MSDGIKKALVHWETRALAAEAEVQRLRALVSVREQEIGHGLRAIDAAQAECERLRSLVAGRVIVERIADPCMDDGARCRYRARLADTSWIASDYYAETVLCRAFLWLDAQATEGKEE